MIEIRRIRASEAAETSTLLKAGGIDLLDWSCEHFLVVDGSKICGVCGFKQEEDSADIKFIWVAPQDRGFKFGDGLLRAVLNYLDLNGVKSVTIQSNSKTNAFYMSEGLQVLRATPEDSERLVFIAMLPDFFNKPCKGQLE